MILAVLAVIDTTIAIVPRPARITPAAGAFTLSASTEIVTDRAMRDIGYALADFVFPATGFRLPVRATSAGAARVITIRGDTTLARLGDEGYRLDVTPSRVAVRAYRPAGASHSRHCVSSCPSRSSARRRSWGWPGPCPPSRSRTRLASRGAASTSMSPATSCRRSS